jgi:aminoglycoside phosphotransferase (APT) family kinase protein
MNPTISIRNGDEIDVNKLKLYLCPQLNIIIEDIDIKQYPGGYSNLTYLITINQNDQFVLRKPPNGVNIKSGHDMSREYKIISALFPSFSLVPKPIHYCENIEIIGTSFYLMEKVDGWILRTEMSTETISSSQMKDIFDVFTYSFVALHEIPYEAIGLSHLGNPVNYNERQIEGWQRRYLNAKTEEIESIEKLTHWLSSHIPKSPRKSLIHNDFKYDNLILDPESYKLNAILDWEMSTIGDPLMDLGSSLGYWVNADDPDWLKKINLSPTTLEGNPSREGLLHAYSLKSGLDPGNGVFYYAYGMLKLAVIAQQIYARYKAGLTTDPRFSNLNKVVNACGTMALQSIAKKRVDALF